MWLHLQNKPLELNYISRRDFPHGKEYSSAPTSHIGKNLLLSNFSYAEGLFLFSYAFWTSEISDGNASFYISNSNYTILIAGCYILMSFELDGEAKALIVAIHCANESNHTI